MAKKMAAQFLARPLEPFLYLQQVNRCKQDDSAVTHDNHG